MSKHEGMKVEIYTDIDITGRLEDGRGFPLDQAVMVEGCLRHRGDVVVPVSAAHTIKIFYCIYEFLYFSIFVFAHRGDVVVSAAHTFCNFCIFLLLHYLLQHYFGLALLTSTCINCYCQ